MYTCKLGLLLSNFVAFNLQSNNDIIDLFIKKFTAHGKQKSILINKKDILCQKAFYGSAKLGDMTITMKIRCILIAVWLEAEFRCNFFFVSVSNIIICYVLQTYK